MFTAVAHKNLASVEGYFNEHFTQNDYYATGEVRPGQWIGRGIEPLGLDLQSPVSRKAFVALCDNRNPVTNGRLTQRQRVEGQRRVLFDFTCSAPKSVSVLAVTLGDDRLTVAHEEASRLAFAELESFAAARVRKSGHQRDRTTGNLLAASFLHTSSRALDPQLHTHFTVFNATFDSHESAWKALQAGPMFEAIRYATEVYRNELARRLHEMGYQTRAARHGIEIDGVDEGILQRFSKRAHQRDEAVRELEQKLGRSLSNNEVSHAVHQTRVAKIKGITTSEVIAHQRTQLSSEEIRDLTRLRDTENGRTVSLKSTDEVAALRHSIEHTFERRSVAAEHELLQTALVFGRGQLDLPRLKGELKTANGLVPTENGWTTRKILETEWFLIQTVDQGRNAVAPLHPTHPLPAWLSADQRQALAHLLHSRDRVTGLRGLAGTGKTTALRELATACQAAGCPALFCAPTAAAADVLRKEGFDASTLQSLLLGKTSPAPRTVLVLDEAGAVGIDDLRRLFELALRHDCRVVLSGDTGQHAAVPRGDALRILEEHSSFQFGQLTRIRRQRRADYRAVVELAARKQSVKAFRELERMGAIQELDGETLYTTAAKVYHTAMRENRSVLLVAPTWAEIESVTGHVRSLLKREGVVSSDEETVAVFDSLSWTRAQRAAPRHFRPGLELHFHETRGGFARGETVAVMEVGKQLKVRRSDGSHKILDPAVLAASYDVGERRSLAIAAGDRLLLQANARLGGQRFINGELVSVTSVQKETITLADGRVLPKNYRTFTHGYAVTSHAAQGKTVDEVLLVASSRSLAAVHQQQFYVSISRGRERCQVFTDDAEQLRAHVGRANARTAAVEALPVPRQRLTTGRYLRSLVQRALRWSEAFRRRIGFGLQASPATGMKRTTELSQNPSIRPSHAQTL